MYFPLPRPGPNLNASTRRRAAEVTIREAQPYLQQFLSVDEQTSFCQYSPAAVGCLSQPMLGDARALDSTRTHTQANYRRCQWGPNKNVWGTASPKHSTFHHKSFLCSVTLTFWDPCDSCFSLSVCKSGYTLHPRNATALWCGMSMQPLFTVTTVLYTARITCIVLKLTICMVYVPLLTKRRDRWHFQIPVKPAYSFWHEARSK